MLTTVVMTTAKLALAVALGPSSVCMRLMAVLMLLMLTLMLLMSRLDGHCSSHR